MEQLLARHPDLQDIITTQKIKRYKILNENNDIVEQWEKRPTNHWQDVTAREKAKAEIARLQEELEILSKQIAKMSVTHIKR